MPYPPKIVRVAIQASLQDGEQMVHTFHVKDVTPGTEPRAPLQELATGVRDKWVAGLAQVYNTRTWLSYMSASTRYDTVRCYDIDPATGRAKDLAEAAFTTGNVGTSAGTWPTEVALCATLGTGFPGRTRRGRLYLGGLGNTLALTATGRVSPEAATTAASFLAGFFRQVRAIGVGTGEQDEWEPHVASLTTGKSDKITTVSVGNVFDVQRRRRNKISEARTLVNVG